MLESFEMWTVCEWWWEVKPYFMLESFEMWMMMRSLTYIPCFSEFCLVSPGGYLVVPFHTCVCWHWLLSKMATVAENGNFIKI